MAEADLAVLQLAHMQTRQLLFKGGNNDRLSQLVIAPVPAGHFPLPGETVLMVEPTSAAAANTILQQVG